MSKYAKKMSMTKIDEKNQETKVSQVHSLLFWCHNRPEIEFVSLFLNPFLWPPRYLKKTKTKHRIIQNKKNKSSIPSELVSQKIFIDMKGHYSRLL